MDEFEKDTQTYVCANCQIEIENEVKIIQLPTNPLARYHPECLYYEVEFQAKAYKMSPNRCPLTHKPIYKLERNPTEAWEWPNQRDKFEEHYAAESWEVKGGSDDPTKNLGCMDKLGDIAIDIAGAKGNPSDFGGGREAYDGAEENEDDEDEE